MRSTDSLQKPSSSGHMLDKVQLLAIGAIKHITAQAIGDCSCVKQLA